MREGTPGSIEAVLPDWLVTVVQLTPLYQGVDLMRALVEATLAQFHLRPHALRDARVGGQPRREPGADPTHRQAHRPRMEGAP